MMAHDELYTVEKRPMRLECPDARICWQFDGRCNTDACACRHKAEHLALIDSLDAAKARTASARMNARWNIDA